jgi:hypothetical protein
MIQQMKNQVRIWFRNFNKKYSSMILDDEMSVDEEDNGMYSVSMYLFILLFIF